MSKKLNEIWNHRHVSFIPLLLSIPSLDWTAIEKKTDLLGDAHSVHLLALLEKLDQNRGKVLRVLIVVRAIVCLGADDEGRTAF